MKAHIFFTMGTGLISRMIRRITVPPSFQAAMAPSHCGIAFESEEGDWTCAEAHARTGGFTGWFPLAQVEEWALQKRGRLAWRIEMELDSVAVYDLQAKTYCHIGFHPYDKKQLLQLWAKAALSIPFPKNPAKAVCSEMVSRILAAHVNIPQELGLRGHDYVTPWHVFQVMQRWGGPICAVGSNDRTARPSVGPPVQPLETETAKPET